MSTVICFICMYVALELAERALGFKVKRTKR